MLWKNKQKGLVGEDLAAFHLKSNNYSILERNYSNKLGEIDIIASFQDELIFIEVKTRTNTKFGDPAEAVTITKQKQVIKVAQQYIAKHDFYDKCIRFDVIAILIITDQEPQLNHIQYAFTL